MYMDYVVDYFSIPRVKFCIESILQVSSSSMVSYSVCLKSLETEIHASRFIHHHSKLLT